VASVLLVLSICHVCFFFAASVTWLSFVNLYTIDSLTLNSSAFEVAYTTVYFILTLVVNAVVTLPVVVNYFVQKISPDYKDVSILSYLNRFEDC
jgi:hypothetical protein